MADGYDYKEVTKWLKDWLAQNGTINVIKLISRIQCESPEKSGGSHFSTFFQKKLDKYIKMCGALSSLLHL